MAADRKHRSTGRRHTSGTVHCHKTAATQRRAQVVPISDQLRLILKDARQRTDTYVVEYRGRPVKTIRGGLRSAVERAGLPFGRAVESALVFEVPKALVRLSGSVTQRS